MQNPAKEEVVKDEAIKERRPVSQVKGFTQIHPNSVKISFQISGINLEWLMTLDTVGRVGYDSC